MKKYLIPALALGLVMTSCQSDEPFAPGEGGEKQVTFTLNVPGELGTRAAAGANQSDKGGATNQGADQIKYTLVLQANNDTQILNHDQATVSGTTATFKPTVVLGREYTITAYASLKDAWNGVNPIEITNSFNDESKDAYFKTLKYNFANGDLQPLTLTRPYGKLRLIAEDYDPTKTKVEKVTVTYNNPQEGTFNPTTEAFTLATGNATGTTKDFGYYEAADATGAHTIFAEYLPTPKDKESEYPVTFTVTVKYKNDPSAQIETYSRTFNDIPVRRNALTTLKGAFFTAGAQITVNVDDNFDNFIPGEGNDKAEEQLRMAAIMGGSYTLQSNVTLSKPLKVEADMTLNLNGNTITAANAKGNGAAIEVAKGVSAKLMGGTIKNTTDNGDAAINSVGNLVLNGVHVEGAPLADGGHPEYAVYANGGTLVVEEGTKIESYRGAIRLANGADVTINGGEVKTTLSSGLTSHVVYAYGSNSKLTINNGEFTMNFAPANDSGASVICPAGATIDIYGGNFEFTGPKGQGGVFQNYMGYGAPVNVYGGVYNDATVNKNLAAGYKTIFADNLYYVLPEAIANAAGTANVTTVTESTSEFKTAITTDNGEGTLFMWNDVAYIAEYGKVNILASEEGKTTVRAIVEESAAVKEANVVEGIEVVGNRTFRKCANLETVALPNTLTEIGPAVFQSCSKLANVTIPANVKTIGEGAFAECTSLTSINIPDGVTRLEKEVLRTTGLTSIEIPASVTYFGTFAFRDCKQLKEVVINAPEFTTEANAFGVMAGALPGTVIYVVNAEMKAYLESTLTYKSQFVVKLISERQ